MARRTKLDAEKTRLNIVKAAQLLFASQGVHQTTLEQIAVKADVTRGAVYGHFDSKNEILQAIGERTATVLKARISLIITEAVLADPLKHLELYLQKILREIQKDEEMYQAFSILNCKCEYIEAYKAVLDRMVFCYHEHVTLFTNIYTAAIKKDLLRPGLKAKALATDTYAFLSGLIRLVLIEYYHNSSEIKKIISNHVALRRK